MTRTRRKTIDSLAEQIRDMESFLVIEREGEVYHSLIRMVEKPLIELTLSRTEGNKLRAARILGINRNTLYAKIKQLKIDAEKFRRVAR